MKNLRYGILTVIVIFFLLILISLAKADLRTISFSGYAWDVKSSEIPVGPGPNYFSDSSNNVWLDTNDHLHLKITKVGGIWYCAEIGSQESFGYGKHIFYLTSRVDLLNENVVLGLFTWSDSPEYNHREIDIEFSRWSQVANDNSQYVVQPWYHLANMHRFNTQLNGDYSTHSFDWTTSNISFQSLHGHYYTPPDSGYLIQSWNYAGGDIPLSGTENARMNLWLNNGNPPSDDQEVEIVVKKFEFIPHPFILSITPNSGYNNQEVNITDLAGVNFINGASVKLTKSGQADINAADVNVVTSNKITCKFDLTGKVSGGWNVVVTNPGGTQPETLANGFTIHQYTPPSPPDNQKPTGSISINHGSTTTHSTSVNLSFQATDNVGVTGMVISNNSNFSGASWQSFVESKAWVLPSGDGEKTVYAKFKDAIGNESQLASDSINLVTQKKVIRLAGPTRYETAVSISKEGWAASDKVILARGDLFPDALAGATLAAKFSAPTLLTNPVFLTSSTKDEIVRLKAKEVFILGSSNAVSEEVVSELKEKCSIESAKIHRYGGETRYETAAQIANEIIPPPNKTCIIAYGENYPDALASASAAAYKGMPILLVKMNEVPPMVRETLKASGANKTIIVGGSDVVSDGVKNWLTDHDFNPIRLGGDTRYDTCYLISDHILNNMGMGADAIGVAFGENFPDALTLGPLAGRLRAPILLVRDTFIPDKIKEFITSHRNEIYQVYLAGGPDAVSDEVAGEIKTIIGAQ